MYITRVTLLVYKSQKSSIMNEPHLIDAFNAKADHLPETRYWSAAGKPKYTNQLILSGSPYLLQHAHTPVDWFPWSEETFEHARSANKPVFLSVGYSTCHWCQVMKRESFEDEEIARLLNERFISVKVDREELPDVDSIYMEFLQITTGEGGWPLNVFLTPEKRPIFASSYLPARDGDRGVKLGLLTYLKVMSRSWSDPRLLAQGEAPLKVLSDYALQSPVPLLNLEWLNEAAERWMADYDEDWGGFTDPPKFVRPAMLEALLRAWHNAGDPRLLEAVEVTLERLYCGGIYDQVGGGVSRYSVDNRWWLPHFEKMLYDNAQLITAALEVFQITKRAVFSDLARDTLSFIERELSLGEGRWCAAIDAESLNERSDRVEGYFYTWAYEELEQLLSPEELEWVIVTFGIEPDGNIRYRASDDASQTKQVSQAGEESESERSSELEEPNERSASTSTDSVSAADASSKAGDAPSSSSLSSGDTSSDRSQHYAQELHGRNLFRLYDPFTPEERTYWEPIRERLYRARATRPRPARDAQVICVWNAFTLSAFSRAAAVLRDERYLKLARETARFLTEVMWSGTTLRRVWRAEDERDQPAEPIEGVLEDYMALTLGLLDFFEASGEVKSLKDAMQIYEAAERFFDQERGGFFRCTEARREQLICDEKPVIDGAEPSGNALAAIAAIRLHQLTGLSHYRAQADSTLKAIGSVMSVQPTACPKALCALAQWFERSSFEGQGALLICQVPRGQSQLKSSLSSTAWQSFQPYMARLTLDHVGEPLRALVPGVTSLPAQVEAEEARLCSTRGCAPPINDVSALRVSLSKL